VPLKTLKNRAEFQRVQAGSKWAAKAFVLQGLARTAGDADGPRFGFAVGSKALAERPKAAESAKTKGALPAKTKAEPVKRPGAVMRNRARRRLKEAVRIIAPRCANADFDYVIIGRREALHQGFADLLEDMQLAFEKVHRPPRMDKAPRQRSAPQRAVGADQRKTS
jgi:ribonuclease P protein component